MPVNAVRFPNHNVEFSLSSKIQSGAQQYRPFNTHNVHRGQDGMRGRLPRDSTQVVLTAGLSDGNRALLHGADVGPSLSVGCNAVVPFLCVCFCLCVCVCACVCVCVFVCACVCFCVCVCFLCVCECFCVGRKKTLGQLNPQQDMLHHRHSITKFWGQSGERTGPRKHSFIKNTM